MANGSVGPGPFVLRRNDMGFVHVDVDRGAGMTMRCLCERLRQYLVESWSFLGADQGLSGGARASYDDCISGRVIVVCAHSSANAAVMKLSSRLMLSEEVFLSD